MQASQSQSTPSTLLTDSFGRVHDYLRISLTDHCNLRCTYCMPEDKTDFASSSKLMNVKEVTEIAKVFVRHGVNKIRLTGGEPLVRKDVKEILSGLSELGVNLTMTTNAVRVHEFISEFKRAGIRSLNVSLDTFNREKFKLITRRDEFALVYENIQLLIEQGFHVKLNVVAMKNVNVDEICDFVEFTRQHPVHVRFIEFMPFAGNKWERDQVVSYREMLDTISGRFQYDKLYDEQHSTAKKYALPGAAGTFAFINTITLPFCGDCNRLRLTADGKMKNCLFSKGEMDLLTPLRNGENIEQLISASVKGKAFATGGQDLAMPLVNRSMVAIGG